MNKIHSKVWSKAHNAMVVVSELARGAGKGKRARARISTQRKLPAALILAVMMGGASIAQAVTVDVDGTTEILNSTDTYTDIHAINSGVVDAAGNTVTILGTSLDGVILIESDATLILDGGGTLENTGTVSGSHGLSLADGKATLTGVKVTAKADNGFGVIAKGASEVGISGGTVTAHGINASAIHAGGDSIVTLADGVELTTTNVQARGLYVIDNASVIMSGGNVTTLGGGFGVSSGGDATLTMTDGVIISTQGTGVGAVGMIGFGNTAIAMSGGSITTEGENAFGVNLGDAARATLSDGVTISTKNKKAYGIFAGGNSTIEMSGGDINTEGLQAVGVDVVTNSTINLTDGVTIETHGLGAYGLSANYNAQANMIDGDITTKGQFSNAVLSRESSAVTLSGVALKTEGDSAGGINASVTSTVSMVGGTIDTQGEHSSGVAVANDAIVELVDGVAITTAKKSALGIYAHGNAAMTMSGGSIKTAGETSYGVYATDDADVALTDGVAIHTVGDNASGIYFTLGTKDLSMAGGSITTEGTNAHGVNAVGNSGKVMLTNNVVITTTGENANGLYASSGSRYSMSGGSIATSGKAAMGILAMGSQIALADGVAVKTAGDNAHGIDARPDTQISMIGGSIATTGDTAIGIRTSSPGLGSGASPDITLDDVAVTTSGKSSYGVSLIGDSKLHMTGGSVTVSGTNAHGIQAYRKATAVLNGVTITANNKGSFGVRLLDEASVNMVGGQINVTGMSGYGLEARSDANLKLTDAVEIVTGGAYGRGMSAADHARITMEGGSITAVGDVAYGAWVGDAAQLALSDVSITTTGADSIGLFVGDDASANLNRVAMDTTGASIARRLAASGLAPQSILIANSDLTQNNGVLLKVTGSNLTDPTVLHLTDGTLAMGDITDVSTMNRNTLSLASGSQWTGSRLDGNLTLTDAGTATHGGTVAAPVLISGDVTVSNGASLGGNLDVAGVLSGSSGTLRPGNSVGTQTFSSAGGFIGDYHAEINAAGQSDRITVTTGPFDLTGTNLYVDEADGNGGYKLDHDYIVVTTGDATGISSVANNEFANGGELEGSLASSLVKLDPVIYGDDIVKIRLSVDKAKQLTLTHNQNAVVEAAQTNPAVQKATQMAGYADALDHLSGEIHASTQTALLDSGTLMRRTLANRMRGNAGSPSCADTVGSDRDKTDQTMDCSQGYPLWAQVVGSWSHYDGDSNTASTRYRQGGLYIGGDKAFDSGWRVGGAVGFTDGRISADERDSSADVKSYTAALYGGKGWALSRGQLNLLMGAGYTYHDIDTDRDTNVLGSQRLSADYHANSIQLFAELGYAMPVSSAAYVEPYLNLGWSDLRTQGFSESGGSTALQADSDHNQVFTQTLGLRGGTVFTTGKTELSLLAGLGWRHANGDLDATRTMSFSQGGGDRFEIKGAPIARNAAVLDLGAEAQLGKNTALGLSYAGQFSSRGNDNTGSLYLRVKF